ncbi:lantibiotic dehydratase [Streptomyces sp. NPDC056049]|uniref:lantibiotic dehydratase n=1 Tax=Streptomyces sp. NPDC056049 TaxID=3345693 RepID=UPI0035D83CC7
MTTTERTAPGWEVGRRFLLRAAGLPVETVRGLRCPRARAWADEVLAHEERLAGEGEALSEVLHGLVEAADASGDLARRALLALRRQIFNNRLPADPDAAERLVAGLDPAAGARVGGWLKDRARYAELLAEGPGLLAEEVRGARGALRSALAEDRLRLGLLLASPTLDSRLDAYLADRAAEPDRRMRKIERSALTYLSRTACKTSPFSTLTPVASGVFTDRADDGAGDDTAGGTAAGARAGGTRAAGELRIGEAWSSHVRLTVVALARIEELILADPVRRRDLPVVLSPGWGRDEDRIRYVRQWVTAGDDSAAVTFDAVRDRLFYLRSSGVLERLLGFLGAGEGLRYGDLTGWLRREHGAEPAECERYAAALLGVGMVQVPALRPDVHDGDPLRSFQEALRGLGADWAETVAGGLDGPAECLARYPAAGLAERRALLRELRQGLLGVLAGLGAEEPTLPQTLLYEDVSAGDAVTAGAELLGGETGRALRAVEGVLPLFDLTLPHRITLHGFFLARYGRGGRCDDLLGLVHDFHEDLFDQYLSFTAGRVAFDADGTYVPEENWLGQPALRSLDEARRRFAAGMREAWERDGGAEELRLPASLLSGVAAELAPVTGDFVPRSHHLQVDLGGGADGHRVVLNRSYGGPAFPFSRFTHVFDGEAEGEGGSGVGEGRAGLSARLREELRERQPEGAVFAELTGGPVTSNLNLHGRLTDHQIVCPGETSTVPAEARIELDDLSLTHDEETDRLVLRSRRLGRRVIPVYLGYLVPVALPAIPRTLLLLSPSTMAPADVWGGVPVGPAVDGVTRRPRVTHGDVVLARRAWTAETAVLPVRRPGGDESAWWLGWRRWQRTHGLPDRVFATPRRAGRRVPGAKPLYVDFESPLSLTAFDALIDRGEGASVVLREALPAEDGLQLVSARGRHVAELAVETFTSPAPRTPARTATEDGPTCRN